MKFFFDKFEPPKPPFPNAPGPRMKRQMLPTHSLIQMVLPIHAFAHSSYMLRCSYEKKKYIYCSQEYAAVLHNIIS